MRVPRTIGKSISYGIAGLWLVLTMVFLLMNGTRASSTPDAPATPQDDKPAEQVFKNIQVLKGLPSSRLLTEMHFMRASLGVRCDHCHIAENSKYWMDEKPAKQTARQMIQMVFDINKNYFGGKQVVSCNTCHRGQTQPVAVPPVWQGAFQNTTRAEPGAVVSEPLPTVDEVLSKYVQALGGQAAIDKIKTRVMKVSLMRPKLVNPSQQPTLVEVYQMAPDKYLSISKSEDGIVVQGSNGSVGWIKTDDGQRAMTSEEVARVKRQSDLRRDLKLKEQYSKMAVVGKEKVGEREAFVVEGLALDERTERLFFDTQTGLLLRKIVLTQTMLGKDPEQTDYENYQDVSGVKLPFTVRVSHLDNNHLGLVRTYTEIKHNVPVDATKFEMPPAAK